MIKKLINLTLIGSLLFVSGVFPTVSYAKNASDLQDIQKERQEIQQNLSAQEQKMNELLAEMQQLDDEVQALQRQLEQKQAEVNQITEQIEQTIDDIAELQEEIEELEESIAYRFELLKTRASSYQQTGGGINFLEVLFGSQNFGDFISRLTAVNQIADSDKKLMDQLDKDIELVEAHKETTMEKLNELNVMYDAQQEQLAAISKEKEQQEVSKQKLGDIQQQVVAQIGELETKDDNLQAMESKVKAEIAAAEKEKARVAAEKARLAKAKEAEAREIAQAEAAAVEEAKKKESELVHVAKKEDKEKPKVQTPAPNKPKEEASADEKSFIVSSTAYTANCNGCSGITATGINLKKNPNQLVIAVDPSVIPLGSIVLVEGYGYAVAGDTGSAIKGKKIDVFKKTKAEAYAWGRKSVRVTIQ